MGRFEAQNKASSIMVSIIMMPCPHIDVLIGGITVSCLLDSGSMVSMIPESFSVEHCAPRAYIPVFNVRRTNVLLYPHTGLGIYLYLYIAQVVSLPAGITEVRSTLFLHRQLFVWCKERC